MRLVKLGYGTLIQVREMNAREVLQALHYEDFLAEYEAAFYDLNKRRDS